MKAPNKIVIAVATVALALSAFCIVVAAGVTLISSLTTCAPATPGARAGGATQAIATPAPPGATDESSPTPIEKSPSPEPEGASEMPEPLPAWWTPEWSQDGTTLKVRYTAGKDRLSESIRVRRSLSPSGVQIAGQEATHRAGIDVYGREQDVTIGMLSGLLGRLKPDSLVAQGTFTYPAEAGPADALFTRILTVTISCDYNEKGQLQSGSGHERVSGQIATTAGQIPYSGNATGGLTVRNGQFIWTERSEETRYGDGAYAKTVAVITGQTEYLGGQWRQVSETTRTSTTYADGSQRESEIVILWQRNEHGVVTGKSGSGTVSGTEVVGGRPVEYSGWITVDYAFDSRRGWYKAGYSETRSANGGLPKRLPFEVLFVDDPYLRPVF